MRAGYLLLPGLLLLSLAGLANLPASWLDASLARASHGRWRLLAAEGSVWEGGATPAFMGEDGQVLPLARLAWSWQGRALWRGRLAWQLNAGAGNGARIEFGRNALLLEKVSLQLPVAALAGLDPAWRNAGLGGDLDVDVRRLAWEGGRFDGGAHLEWMAASSALSTEMPFGRYALEASADGTGLALHLGTLAGPLALAGDGRWQPGAPVRMAGRADSPPERYPALKPLLLMLGRPDSPTGASWRLLPS
ncbi:type II secretion system protein N [Paludibacterium yongneupense]|uniref:type II secretion system protein N n=1 Tax=Paludibacterium yongneupense TaxID=400061 RepID=UPI00040F4EE7|nr:type II secretion system protein N [Paludibacterium yongneupense]